MDLAFVKSWWQAQTRAQKALTLSVALNVALALVVVFG
jgi:hypothetical protein